MGKNDFLTPKAIANRIKAKGLQKLRWYCQMCQKQCRDENGFKCHLSSDSHRRQMEVFGQDPDRVIDGYSEEFHTTFIEHLKMAHPSMRVEAHKVYNEFIQDRHHIHMNSTKWLTLSEYVKYLGKEGICTVEESPKGWFIRLIQREPADIEREAQEKKRKRAEMADGRREEKRLAAQAAAARDATGNAADNAADDAAGDGGVEDGPARRREEREGPLQLSMQSGGAESMSGADAAAHPKKRRGAELFGKDDDRPSSSGRNDHGGSEQARKRNKVEELMASEKARKEREAAAAAAAASGHSGGAITGPWIAEGIAVKVMAEQLGDDYYKKKGEVMKVDGYVAEVAMFGSGDVVRIDQAQLETVIPKAGGTVLILVGQRRGDQATVRRILTDEFQVELELPSGKLVREDYECVSKLLQ